MNVYSCRARSQYHHYFKLTITTPLIYRVWFHSSLISRRLKKGGKNKCLGTRLIPLHPVHFSNLQFLTVVMFGIRGRMSWGCLSNQKKVTFYFQYSMLSVCVKQKCIYHCVNVRAMLNQVVNLNPCFFVGEQYTKIQTKLHCTQWKVKEDSSAFARKLLTGFSSLVNTTRTNTTVRMLVIAIGNADRSRKDGSGQRVCLLWFPLAPIQRSWGLWPLTEGWEAVGFFLFRLSLSLSLSLFNFFILIFFFPLSPSFSFPNFFFFLCFFFFL